jgi:serine/threonine protein kinase/TolA-binding protein
LNAALFDSSSSSDGNGEAAAGDARASEAARAMAAAWHSGQRPGVEEVLEAHPELAATPRTALRLISEELYLRRESGEPVPLNEILARFPQWRAELELLLACHDLFEVGAAPPDFPEAGERCGEFDLLREIGRGSQGRVFLATQPSLCDRPVVIKLTPLDVTEHLSLARLQHTGIVPLYLAQDLPERRLRLLCMPFMGGASLAAVLAAMKPTRVGQRTGKTIADALARCHLGAPQAAPLGGPAFDFLCQASYVQAVCWIGACLAEALDYAHQRGLVHFDLKPSNLLLAGDGQPMLLDFHLARGPIAPGRNASEWVGGTQQYMPPEQAAALAAVRAGQPVEAVVDARADIFALGVVLDELLGGDGPLARPADGSHGLRHVNPHVSQGLADILSKCLFAEAEGRYAAAQALGDDLRRQLANLPLRGVRNRSPLELWRKWRRRQPHAAIRVASTSVACAAVAAAVWLWAGQRIEQSQLALVDGQQLLDRQAYSEAIDRLQQALDGLRPLPAAAALKQALRERLELGRRAKLEHELHQFAERLRFLDGPVESSSLRSAQQACETFWSARHKLLPADSSTASLEANRARADLLDLVVFWLDAQSRLPGAQEPVARKQASDLLSEAEATLGASEVLEYERRRLFGDSEPAADEDRDSGSTSSGEPYRLGRFHLRSGQVERALGEFRRAVRNEPQDFWANYYRGRCAYRLERFDEALNAFCACVALAPAQAECFYNRALVYAALGQKAEALLDYDRALKLDPALSAAAEQREALRRRGH